MEISNKDETIFSDCRKYRYVLHRNWIGGEGAAMFIMLNPSVADETRPDNTMTRCVNFAKSWGYSDLYICNLFGYVATDRSEIKKVFDPVGRDNDAHLLSTVAKASIVIAAWGADGVFKDRDEQVKSMVPNLHFLKLTKDGHPQHPLYLGKKLLPQKFT